MIPVTKAFLPPIEEYQSMLGGIWQRHWLTNNGPLVNELEVKLREHLEVSNLICVSSGTMALQIAIKALDLKGEVITTPFSFIATTSAIAWQGCLPVMVDIDPETLNIDPSKIEAAITPNTTAILATHVFGNPCDIDAINIIAKKHALKVIYDASHCFGTYYKGQSIFEYGDVSTTSFHTSKVYHTIEGGAIFSKDISLLRKMAYMRNFGFNGPENFACLGINGKMSEFHAAMGLVNLKHVTAILEKRKTDFLYYSKKLKASFNIRQKITSDTKYNYAYYPLIFSSEEKLKQAESLLNDYWIFPRRYFYPPLHTLNYVNRTDCSNCMDVAARILCLPTYYQLSVEEQDLIIRLLQEVEGR